MAEPLTQNTIAIVKSTAPLLKQHGLAITSRMYERLFVNEEVKQMFDQAAQESGEQPRRLAAAILGYAEHNDIDHIVLGARSSSAVRRHLGSVSTKVVAEARCSVSV
ncbi:MAG: universal stress protein, partial [Rhizobium oryzihabitans]